MKIHKISTHIQKIERDKRKKKLEELHKEKDKKKLRKPTQA
jgi:hypothetical protein